MTPLDDLPADQRAVVELVLRRGRTYDEIGRMLSIDRAGVRERALSALDSLGPQTGVPAPMRALVTDYLLGQLPDQVGADVARRLGSEPAARAWARVIASELSPMASNPLPPIPSGGDEPAPAAGAPVGAEPVTAEPEPASAEPLAAEPRQAQARQTERRQAEPAQAHAPAGEPAPAAREPRDGRRSSRRGGAILLGVGAVVVIAVVLVIVLNSGGGSKAPTTATTAATTPAGTSANTGTTGTTPKALDTVKLTAAASGSKAQGVAEVFLQSGTPYMAIVAIHLPANSSNYYAVWLTNGPSDSRLLGFAPKVTGTGNLQAATALKTTDSRYKQMVVTVETTAHPTKPGTPVLTGTLNLNLP